MAMRQMETTPVKVGGYNFFIRPFAAFKAANITGELASTLAPLLGVLAPFIGKDDESEEGTESGGLLDTNASKAAEAMSGCVGLDGDKLELLMKKLLLGGHIVVEVPDEEGNVEAQVLNLDIANEVFCGEIQDMFILCYHVLKLNFKGFFKKFAGLSGKQKEEAAEEQPAQRKIL